MLVNGAPGVRRTPLGLAQLYAGDISNYNHYKVWDEITYPFLNFNGYTVEI